MPGLSQGEEGRDKLRKAVGIGKYESIRGSPNGTTQSSQDDYPIMLEANPGN